MHLSHSRTRSITVRSGERTIVKACSRDLHFFFTYVDDVLLFFFLCKFPTSERLLVHFGVIFRVDTISATTLEMGEKFLKCKDFTGCTMLIHQIIDESPARKEATGRKKETVKKKKKVKGRKLKDSNLENLIYYHPRRFGIPSGRYDGRLSYREKRANNFLKRKSSKKKKQPRCRLTFVCEHISSSLIGITFRSILRMSRTWCI